MVALTSGLEGSAERKPSQSGREVAEEKHYAYVRAHMQIRIYQTSEEALASLSALVCGA